VTPQPASDATGAPPALILSPREAAEDWSHLGQEGPEFESESEFESEFEFEFEFEFEGGERAG
jgi:hypothetical protein